VWRPHLAREVLDADGEVVSTAQAEQIRRIEFDPYVRAQMLEGFAGVTASESGTAYGAFVGFPLDVVPVAGKTGTAQVQGKGDTSLFAAYFPANAPEYVVVAVVEEAGQGAAVAAPIVRRVIEAMTGIATDRPIEVFRGAHD
jgi:penicillin-binding protein 2